VFLTYKLKYVTSHISFFRYKDRNSDKVFFNFPFPGSPLSAIFIFGVSHVYVNIPELKKTIFD
jgi:hypothetical protein